MVHWYVQYNGHGLTIRVNFMVKCVCMDIGSNGFMTKTQPSPIDSHYRMDIISGMSYSRSDSDLPQVFYTECCAMVGALALYYRSLGTMSTLLRMSNISDRPYC